MKEEEQFKRLLEIAAVSGMGGLILGIAKVIIHDQHGSVFRFFRGAVSSVVVAVIVAFALADSGMSWPRQGAIIGILAYVADDMLVGLLILGKLFANNPVSFIRDVWASIKGKDKSS
jgi:NADH:ubiquinone oxidoreductase subunit 4 (subunit M)